MDRIRPWAAAKAVIWAEAYWVPRSEWNTTSAGRSPRSVNAMAESFFATLKTEFYYRRVWPTKKSARIEVGKWIEDRYNRRRRHVSIGQISPVAFELQYSRQIADSQRAA